jgi:hypothetical protein
MYQRFLIVTVCVLLAASARDASAQAGQPWTDRGYFNLNVGFESGTGTLTDDRLFDLYGERGTTAVAAGVDSGALLDFSVGSRVWRNVSVGIGFHRGGSSGDAAVASSVPHPIFFNQNRPSALNVTGLDRTERAVHLQFGYMIPVTEILHVHVFAGPSFFNLRQEVVSDVTFTESPPFTTVAATPVIARQSDSATGAHIGVDVGYTFIENVNAKLGAGMFVRYAGATANILVLQNVVESSVGGFQIGFGARVLF